MTSDYARAVFFDASALVKLYVPEPKSHEVKAFFSSEPTKFTTTFCFYEAMSIMKSKWKKSLITQDEYLESCFRLAAWFGHNDRYNRNPDLTDAKTLCDARDLAKSHGLDMSDALQLLTVRDGTYSSFGEGSRTVFVTADRELARVAKEIGLKTWNVLDEPAPQRGLTTR
jgi:predicted nucleic acid-binding protein